MKAFHNDPAVKEKYLLRVRAHAAADEIIKGIYWEHGRGCAVGCTVHSSDHKVYRDELGIPIIIARLEDRIFEGLPLDLAKTWPIRFLEAVAVGCDLSKVWPKFAIFLLTDASQCASRLPICGLVSDAYKSLLEGATVNWSDIRSAANAAANAAAADAAAYVTYVTYVTYAADAYAADAATAAAYAYVAAYVAAAADAAADTAAAYAAAYIKQSEKLLELLRECK